MSRSDLGIFPLIGIGNFVWTQARFFIIFFLNVRAQFVAERRRTRNVTLANLPIKCLQCGNNLN